MSLSDQLPDPPARHQRHCPLDRATLQSEAVALGARVPNPERSRTRLASNPIRSLNNQQNTNPRNARHSRGTPISSRPPMPPLPGGHPSPIDTDRPETSATPTAHRGHGWLHWLMCLPMLLIVGYLVLTGAAGGGAILYALGC